jgi:hypothetical protein
VPEPNSFGNPEFLKDLEFIQEQLSATDIGQDQTESQARSDLTELADLLAAHGAGAASADPAPDLVLNEIIREFRLNQVLEQACLATGATGVAIALVRGEEMVCHASTGPQAPDIGVCLDPRTGLSGSCIQTRQLQQCNDTETDPRVDPALCRDLGVRSIVVLPLIDGDELFGVFEILSSRPNAFSQRDLDSLQALTDRIVESRRENWEATAALPRIASGSFPHKLEELVPQHKSPSSESDSGSPRRKRTPRRNDITAAMHIVLVIASAVLLGTLVGWRLGWQKATLGFRANSPRYRIDAPSKTGRTDNTVFPGNELPRSAWTDECGQSVAVGPPAQPSSGGLTVCEGGRVIFRLPPSAPSPIRDSLTSQRSPGLEAHPSRR